MLNAGGLHNQHNISMYPFSFTSLCLTFPSWIPIKQRYQLPENFRWDIATRAVYQLPLQIPIEVEHLLRGPGTLSFAAYSRRRAFRIQALWKTAQ